MGPGEVGGGTPAGLRCAGALVGLVAEELAAGALGGETKAYLAFGS